MRAQEFITEGQQQKPVIVYPNHKGATIDDSIKNSLPVTNVPVEKLQLWEKHKSMQDPKVADWVNNKLLPELKQNGKLKPLLVWNNHGKLFVIDGNHRLIAYQEAGYQDRVPVQIVPDNMITVSKNMAEGLTEAREGAMREIIRKALPSWPDYVIKDWISSRIKNQEDLKNLTGWLGELNKMVEPNSWKLHQKMFLTFDMLSPKTRYFMKIKRNFGEKNPFLIPRDEERSANAEQLVKTQGMENLPPVIMLQHANGLELCEGWHRTMAAFRLHPDGFYINAWIGQAGKNQGVAENIQLPGDFKLMGQDLFLKNLARNLKQRYPDATVKRSSDRVTAYHNKGDDEALSVMGTEVMDSGYIGVGLDDAFTESFQGVLVPTIKQTTEQLLAANPGTKPALFLSTDNWNPDAWTHIATKLGYRLVTDDEQLDENFADGKVRGKSRPGRVKRAGASCAGSVTDLRAKAKKYGGERGKMYHWCANMKGGKK